MFAFGVAGCRHHPLPLHPSDLLQIPTLENPFKAELSI